MLNGHLLRSIMLVLLLSCSSITLADTCPPANGQVPANWTPMGKVASLPFKGALYGMFSPTTMACKYANSSDPLSGYYLISNFAVHKPTDRSTWQYVAGYLTCLSSNVADCQFDPITQ